MSAGLERTLHRDYYLTDRVFALERERIFFREWLCVAREEELAEPGDYLVRDVAGESILLVRTRSGALAAHYNVCRHRGSQLVPDCERGRFAEQLIKGAGSMAKLAGRHRNRVPAIRERPRMRDVVGQANADKAIVGAPEHKELLSRQR